MDGLARINVELTSRCNKNCWMCGRRQMEKDNPDVEWGDMPFDMLECISNQLPDNIIVQLHNNGEPLLYPRLGDAIRLFDRQITALDTNGKLLTKRADIILYYLDSLSLSVFENDEEAEQQYLIFKEFMYIRSARERSPVIVIRALGDVDVSRYEKFDVIIVRRLLHSPMGSFNYRRKRPTVPEIGICQDFLHHLAIDRHGDVSMCVRFDPNRLGVLGNIKKDKLEDIWNGKLRRAWFEKHLEGKRDEIPLCSICHYWGIPTGE